MKSAATDYVTTSSTESRDMSHDADITEVTLQYAAAYSAHYTAHDLPAALRLYQDVVASYPSTQEAGYAQMQIQNIANAVIPRQQLLNAQIELVLAHFKNDSSTDKATSAHVPSRAAVQ